MRRGYLRRTTILRLFFPRFAHALDPVGFVQDRLEFTPDPWQGACSAQEAGGADPVSRLTRDNSRLSPDQRPSSTSGLRARPKAIASLGSWNSAGCSHSRLHSWNTAQYCGREL